MQEAYPTHEVITDIGSGLNFKRKGLLRMVDDVMRGTVKEIVVSHRDRLCRFAFELIEHLCRRNGTRLVVKDQEIHSAEQELSEDLMAIVHVFSCRHHGMRRYQKKGTSQEAQSSSQTEDQSKEQEDCSDQSNQEGIYEGYDYAVSEDQTQANTQPSKNPTRMDERSKRHLQSSTSSRKRQKV